jgi:predicted nucleic acid-binding protein
MELVVDANVPVAAFLRAGTTRELLLDGRLALHAPEWSLIEAERVLTAPRLRRRLGGVSQAEVRLLLAWIGARIRLLPVAAYHARLGDAERVAPDLTDAPYLAVALHLGVPLWSNDSALKTQTAVLVYTTQELIEVLRRHTR